ncbi:MAG TPA: hypothetical protein VHW01_29985 [Polyangiaceae bacterium]|jgi:hypothetical protein|nr:hypothetical protein [Polyangiaceae bacterium]
MKTGAFILGLVVILGFSGLAEAQEVPPAHRGIQLALRTGYAAELGNVAQGVKMSQATGGQVPFIVDVGGKPIPELFLGGYFGFGFGGEAGEFRQLCDGNGGGCISADVFFGIEAQYQILPAASADPWFGYGVGFESLALGASSNGGSATGLGGIQFARLSGGVDFRLSRTFGVGPFADFSLGKYSSISVGSSSEDIPSTSTHEWLTIGARFVFFP